MHWHATKGSNRSVRCEHNRKAQQTRTSHVQVQRCVWHAPSYVKPMYIKFLKGYKTGCLVWRFLCISFFFLFVRHDVWRAYYKYKTHLSGERTYTLRRVFMPTNANVFQRDPFFTLFFVGGCALRKLFNLCADVCVCVRCVCGVGACVLGWCFNFFNT